MFNIRFMRAILPSLLVLPGLVLLISSAAAQSQTVDASTITTKPLPSKPVYNAKCVDYALQNWVDEAQMHTLREQCEEVVDPLLANNGALEKRIQSEIRHGFEPFVLLPYRPNYVLIASHHFSEMNNAPYEDASLRSNGDLDKTEVKFQVSLKIPMSEDVLGGRLFIAYTSRSFWQAYNDSNSAPFRETNHEPEVWLTFDNTFSIFGWKNRLLDIGLSHQSNGQSDPLSRSWNRVYFRFTFELGNSAISFKPWIRVPEPADKDDNPDIHKYMGAMEVIFATKVGDNNMSIMMRNNFNPDENYGAAELNYSYRIHRNLNGYIQWFYGYGESLIDYNHLNHSLGIGVQLNSWL